MSGLWMDPVVQPLLIGGLLALLAALAAAFSTWSTLRTVKTGYSTRRLFAGNFAIYLALGLGIAALSITTRLFPESWRPVAYVVGFGLALAVTGFLVFMGAKVPWLRSILGGSILLQERDQARRRGRA